MAGLARPSGLFFWHWRMALIYSGPDVSRRSGHGKGNAMRHKNSVYHALLQYVPWNGFDQLVDENHGNKGVRSLTMRDQFSAMLYGPACGRGEFARDRGWPSEPSNAALSRACQAGETVHACRCECVAPGCGLCGGVLKAHEASPSGVAPLARRDGLSH